MRESQGKECSVEAMADSTRTAGELLFERYLRSQDLAFDFEKEHAGKSQRPDYSIEWRGSPILLDVKDFDIPDEVLKGFSGGFFDPYTRIREKIEQGRDKFKQFKEVCCALVLCNLGNPFVALEDSYIMLGAMYGDSGFTFPVNTATGIGDDSRIKSTFLGKGKMIRPHWSKPQNTTISALITLDTIQPYCLRLKEMIREKPCKSIEDCQMELERTCPNFDVTLAIPRVIVWHNAVARIPFPPDLFNGPYDCHFGVVQEEKNSFQRLTFRGSLLPASDSEDE